MTASVRQTAAEKCHAQIHETGRVGRPATAVLADCVIPGGNSVLPPLHCSQFSWSTAAKRLPEVCVYVCFRIKPQHQLKPRTGF